MCDHWMPALTLPLSPEQFQQLPRNGAYRYDYHDGQASLWPRARHYHALLELQPRPEPLTLSYRPLLGSDWDALIPVFAEAFQTTQPFGSLDDNLRMEAARQALSRTRLNRDGPWIADASLVVLADEAPAGAILVTLLPQGDPCDWDCYSWQEPPPADCIARCLGQPHLTWVFVRPALVGRGLGTALLDAAANRLLRLGFRHLLTTFMIGNDASALWHWRNGFRLLAYPGSRRRRGAVS